MSHQPVLKTTNYQCQCGNCHEQMDGYSWKELQDMGWVAHEYGTGNKFHMCGPCEHAYTQRRTLKAAGDTLDDLAR